MNYTLNADGQLLHGEAATVTRKADGYWLEPAEGREPVMLNGRAVAVPARLGPGDKLQIGPLEVEFDGEG